MTKSMIHEPVLFSGENGKPKPVSLNIEDEHGLWLWNRKMPCAMLGLMITTVLHNFLLCPWFFVGGEVKIEGVVEVLHHLFPHRFRDEEVSVQVGNAWNEMFGKLRKRTAATLKKIPGGFLQ